MTTTVAVETALAPSPAYRFPQAKVVGNLVQVSGQSGVDSDPIADNGLEAQTIRALERVEAILRAAGATWQSTLSLRVFLASRADFDAMCVAYDDFMADRCEVPPSRTTVMVELPAHAMRVEIDALGVID